MRVARHPALGQPVFSLVPSSHRAFICLPFRCLMKNNFINLSPRNVWRTLIIIKLGLSESITNTLVFLVCWHSSRHLKGFGLDTMYLSAIIHSYVGCVNLTNWYITSL